MGDLISRKEVITLLCKLHIDNIAMNGKRITEYVKEIPTAYDVEQVVEEIKRVGTAYCVSIHCNNECSNCDHGSIMRSIIEIVKGVE